LQNYKCARYLTKLCPMISKVKGNSPSRKVRECSHPNKQTRTHFFHGRIISGGRFCLNITPWVGVIHNTHYTWPQLETLIIISEGGEEEVLWVLLYVSFMWTQPRYKRQHAPGLEYAIIYSASALCMIHLKTIRTQESGVYNIYPAKNIQQDFACFWVFSCISNSTSYRIYYLLQIHVYSCMCYNITR
jgi:hypothetical protein